MLRFTILAICVAACLATKTTTTTAAPANDVPDNAVEASAACIQSMIRRNHKDLYADGSDCHNYYQCFYVNETYAYGYQRRCAAGLFWHDEVLSCLPEGATACTDRCRDPAIAGVGVYAGGSCRQFFVCANTASYAMCCPEGTSFNSGSLLCEEDTACTAACSQAAPAVATTVAPVRQYNSTVCIDSFGAYLSTVAGVANAFVSIDIATGDAAERQYCATGTLFDLATCRCNIEDESATQPPSTPRRQLKLWLPFAGNTEDQSVNHFSTFLYDGAQYDATQSAIAGTGSLSTDGGYLSVPGLKSYDSRDAGSWAAAFRCSGTCSGSILSNNKDSTNTEYTVQLWITNGNTINARLNFWAPAGSVTLSGTFTTGGWVHVAVTYGSSVARLYINGVNVQSQNIGGLLEISAYPYIVGTDASFGAFQGNVDGVAVASFAFEGSDVVALRDGNTAYFTSNGFY